MRQVRFRKFVVVILINTLGVFAAPSLAHAEISLAKKKAVPIPSPKAVWPPSGFKVNDGVYAKVPSSKELVGLLSAKRSLQKFVKDCQLYACGAVFVAAETGCEWWEVNSSVRRLNSETNSRIKIGSLLTYAKGTDDRELATIFLVSSEPIAENISVGGIRVICHREPDAKPRPGNVYNPIPQPEATQ